MRMLLGLLMVLALGCRAQDRYPDGPILLVCPWAAGGGTDRVARQMAALLEQDLGVPVNVVNVTGGDGVTGHSRGALARPDGYTLTLVTVEIATLHWRGMTNISHRDFAPVGLVNEDAGGDLRARRRPLADAARSRTGDPGEAAQPARVGHRGGRHLASGARRLARRPWGSTPTDVIWVSIAGSAPSLQELLAGGVDIVSCSLAEAQALLARRTHPQPRRDGRRAPAAVRRRADASGAGRGLDARHDSRHRRAEGHAAGSRRACSPPRSNASSRARRISRR